MRLSISTVSCGVNGKGTTRQFCRAFAYGELMERLQNLSFLDDFFVGDLLFNTFSKSLHKKSFFCDSKSINIKTILKIFPDLKSDMELSFFDSDKKFPKKESELINIRIKLNGSSSFECIPFYSVKKKSCLFADIYSYRTESQQWSCFRKHF